MTDRQAPRYAKVITRDRYLERLPASRRTWATADEARADDITLRRRDATIVVYVDPATRRILGEAAR